MSQFKCTSCKYWNAVYPKSDYCAKGKLKDLNARACEKYERVYKMYDERRRWTF